MINFRFGTKIVTVVVFLSASLSACKHTSQNDSSSVAQTTSKVTQPNAVNWTCKYLQTKATTAGTPGNYLYNFDNRLQLKPNYIDLVRPKICFGPATGYEGVPGGKWIRTEDDLYFTEKGNNVTPQWEPLSIGNRHQIWYQVDMERGPFDTDGPHFYIHNWWSRNQGTNQCLAVFDTPRYRNCGLVNQNSYVHLVDGCPRSCVNTHFAVTSK